MAKEIHIYIGNFGSGKTECALRDALKWAMQGKRTALVDLDIVNPFFCSAFHRDKLERAGVRLIASQYADQPVDVPVVSPEVYAAFDNGYDLSVFDVGGDPVGATALGQYHNRLKQFEGTVKTFLVVNVYRPMTNNADDILLLIDRIELAARIKVDALINNANLARETTYIQLLEGDRVLRKVSAESGIPVSHYACLPDVLESLRQHTPDSCSGDAIEIEAYNRPSWLDHHPRHIALRMLPH